MKPDFGPYFIEPELRDPWMDRRLALAAGVRRAGIWVPLIVAIVVGLFIAARPGEDATQRKLRERLHEMERLAHAQAGELELLELRLDRKKSIQEYSREFRVPADLAALIYDAAIAEDIDPGLAFRLVRVESNFVANAVSSAGAVGLAQLMPSTAFELDPSLRYSDLFDRRINLHLGFSYLRLMLERYDGDLRIALLAYNRGPGTVDAVRRRGEDPENGYSIAVLSGYDGD